MVKNVADILQQWIRKHGLNPDNFNLFEHKVKSNGVNRNLYFVYNKAFSKPFMQDQPIISEMQMASEFMLESLEGTGKFIVTMDSMGKLSGSFLSRDVLIRAIMEGVTGIYNNTDNGEVTEISNIDNKPFWDDYDGYWPD
jgi:hypothetical protein